MIRCVVDDVGLDDLDPGVEVRAVAVPLDPSPWAPHEVLVVSGAPDVLAAAQARGVNRLVVADAAATAAAVAELCRELDRP